MSTTRMMTVPTMSLVVLGPVVREMAYFTGPLTRAEWIRAVQSVASLEIVTMAQVEAVVDVIERLHLGDVDMFARLAARVGMTP